MVNKRRLSINEGINRLIAYDLSGKTVTFYQELCREAGKDLHGEIPDVKIRQMLTCKWITYTNSN